MGRKANEVDPWETCARIAETELELPGDPPPEIYALLNNDPIAALRTVVRVTKKSIAARIRNRARLAKENRRAR